MYAPKVVIGKPPMAMRTVPKLKINVFLALLQRLIFQY
jgi:hypothetical protein